MEATRLDPPIPIAMIMETLMDTKLSNAKLIPKGTLFTFNLYAMHRDPT
jgi:cytochrome P450